MLKKLSKTYKAYLHASKAQQQQEELSVALYQGHVSLDAYRDGYLSQIKLAITTEGTHEGSISLSKTDFLEVSGSISGWPNRFWQILIRSFE